MYLLLAEPAVGAIGGTPWWAPLLGVVIGALLGGTAQLAAELLRAKNTRKEAVWASRQQVEIDALVRVEDLIHSIRETLDTVSGSDGNPVDDARQLAAVESLFAAERQMKIQAITIRGIGSEMVAEAIEAISGRLHAFLVKSLAGVEGSDSSALMTDLGNLMNDVISRVRTDLSPE